jgi:heptosyltransferase-2
VIPERAHWIRMPRFVGDALLMHQASARLRASGDPVVAWGPKAVMELFEGSEGYAAVVADDPKAKGLWDLTGLLRRHRPISVLALPKSLRAPAAAFLARVPRRVGCGDGGARLLLNSSLPYWSRDDHSLDRYRDIVSKGYSDLTEPRAIPFRPRESAMAEVAALRSSHGMTGPYAVLAIGAACASKRMSEALMLEMGHRMQKLGISIVLLGGPGEDEPIAQRMRDALPRSLNRVAQGPWSEAAAWMAGAKAVLANDSGLAHLAAVCDAPLVTVFGPTVPRHTAPRNLTQGSVTVVRKEELTCLECLKWVCPIEGHPCMNALSADLLWKPLHAALEA